MRAFRCVSLERSTHRALSYSPGAVKLRESSGRAGDLPDGNYVLKALAVWVKGIDLNRET